MKSPYPWFGGKSKVADLVWQRFGDVPNYVEPFFGSGAVMLARPHAPHTETINDLDCYVANFWRATQADPEAVARYADWPVNEADQHARHLWLVNRVEFRERMKVDPDYYDAKIAGWWVWGLCLWIGSGWCAVKPSGQVANQLPHLGNAGRGVHRERPHLGNAGMGVHKSRQCLVDTFSELSDRLRRVRVCCGDWSRVLGDSVTFKHGTTAVFLDPPYADTADRTSDLYSEDSLSVAHEVRQWCLEHGDNPQMRIALCGYEGEHVMPDSWDCVAWKAKGGYGSQNANGNENAKRERIWFSPHCLSPRQAQLSLAV